ncbi:hypothetical protein [uncultured Senegalimassilia sp.]|uniref:hypothetical protein n=1 Tax=uncultured Senegalimassilia sp. TaxID=1714350 RepID=UPI0027DD522F|nr:hypothetical protein [uncultured Senegalimassilia sp.]
MAKIDTDELRDYLEDYCGTAASSGFPAALLDVADIEDMDGYELCEKAEDLESTWGDSGLTSSLRAGQAGALALRRCDL